VAVGDSTTLSLTVEGRGNVKDSPAPNLELKGFKVYDDQPSFKASVTDGKIGGVKTFKKALVPLENGKLEIPKVTLDYFDPKTGTYRTAETQSFTLNVTKGVGEDAKNMVHVTGGSSKKEVKALGEDIMPIKHGSSVTESDAA